MSLNGARRKSNLDTLPARIGAVIGARFASKKDAAEKVGVTRTTMSLWTGGHKTPGEHNLGVFATVAQVDLSWLKDGVGTAPDLTPRPKAKKPKELARPPANQIEAKTEGVRAFAAVSLLHGMALASIRADRKGVSDWIEGGTVAKHGEWVIVPIDIRLTAG
jgi:hypothetical protein